MQSFNLKPRAMALLTLGGVGVLGFASGAFGTFSSTLLSGYTCGTYGYFVGFGYGYDCTANPSVTVTGGTLSTVSTISGSTNAAESVTIGTGTNVVFNPTGNVRVVIPSSTVITPVGSGTFDLDALALASASVSSGLGTNEQPVGAIDFGVGSGVGLNFSIPVRIDIPVPGYVGSTIAVKVRHAGSSVFTTDGLTNNPNTTCTNGVPGVASANASVSGAVATIYTCQASTFTTYRVISTSSTGGGGLGGGSYVPPQSYTSAIIPVKVPTIAPVVSNNARLKALQERLRLLRAERAKVRKNTEGVQPPVKEVKKVIIVSTPYQARVNVPKISLWNEASMTNSRFLGYLYRNQKVTVLEVQGDWAKIQTSRTTGWVIHSRLIK